MLGSYRSRRSLQDDDCENLSFQLEVHGGKRRKLNAEAAVPVLPRDVLRPDFAEVSDVRSTEHFGVCVENFFPSAAARGSKAVIGARNWREVEYAENLVAVVVFTHETHDGIVGVVAPDPFESGIIMVDFPERGVLFVQAVERLHHLQELSMAVPAYQVPVKRLLFVPFAPLTEFVAHKVELLARVSVLEGVGEA